jgi:hypothetical protein
MAYDAANLRLIQHLGRHNFWHYVTADAAATVDTADYFLTATATPDNRLKLGDVILRLTVDSVSVPTSVSTVGFHVVNGLSATAVDVADTLALTATDTD